MATFLSLGSLLPTICVEVDATTSPTASSRTWTDITPNVRQLSYTRSGRNQELNRSTAGSLQMICSDKNGAITGLGLRKRQWVRVRAQWLGVTYPRWQGIIETLPRKWPGQGADQLVEIKAADVFKVLGLADLAGQTYLQERGDQRVVEVLARVAGNYVASVLAAAPSLYWRLGDSVAGAGAAVDASGNGNAGNYGSGVTLGQPGAPINDPDTAALFNNTSAALVGSSYSAYVSGSQRTFIGWANRSATTEDDTIFGSSAVSELAVPIGPYCAIKSGGNDVFFQAGGTGSTGVTWAGAWPGTAQWVFVALTYNDATKVAELFINGVSKGQQTLGAAYPRSYGFYGGMFAFGHVGAATYVPFNGDLDEIAVYESILSAATILAIYQSPSGSWLAGSIDTNTDTIDAVTTPFADQSMALDYLLQIEDSENGLLIGNPDGTVDFQGRHWRAVNAPNPVATFGESAGQIPYRDDVEYDDDDSLIGNIAAVTPYGASSAIVVFNYLAISKNWPTRFDRQLLSSSTPLAQSAAEWLSQLYGDPSPRIPAITTELAAVARVNSALVADILAADNSSRFTWTRAASTPISQDVYVEQIAEVVDVDGGSWQWKAQLSPADDSLAGWVLGASELGLTTALVY